MADSLLGIVGDGFVLIASDASASRSILRIKEDEDKIALLDSHKMLAGAGPTGDRVQFSEFIAKNVKLYKYRNNLTLSTHATANYLRGELAESLRSSPYQVNLLLGGWDKQNGASLYFIDYLASMHKMDFAAQGYAGYFALSTMDRYYRKGLSVPEAVAILKACIRELALRLVIAQPNWIIKIVDKDGVREQEHIQGKEIEINTSDLMKQQMSAGKEKEEEEEMRS
eukprot:TRINITY_DN292_c0_g1_i1.p1 TRINITY_DN292_c0_g1~~TRINITY_DN292_c0_g1_i1.p1  ORF type:complete len:226 (-),score=64.93 TRINITY_DN292_c0_g1_i1:15-692(-)